MEMEMIFRLALLVGFLCAGFIGILIALAIMAIRNWCKSSMKELDDMLDNIDKSEEASRNES